MNRTLGTADVGVLTDLVEEHPWCSAYRILLAKAYKDADLPQYDLKLHLASLYSGDRSVLFELLHNSGKAFEIQKIEPVAAGTEEHSVDAESAASEIEAQTSNPEPQKVDFESLITYDPIEELVPEEREHNETKDELFERVVYNPEVELRKLIEESGNLPAGRHGRESETDGRESGIESGVEDGSEDQDFFYWLNHVGETENENRVSGGESQESETGNQDVGLGDEEGIKKEGELRVDSSVNPESRSTNSVDEVTSLLDRFLETKKRAPREKRAFYSPEERAQQSEIDDSEVVSETLAKIYYQQEYYLKALDAYRKLSLQNPEKSAYFAARITEIEQKLKSKEE